MISHKGWGGAAAAPSAGAFQGRLPKIQPAFLHPAPVSWACLLSPIHGPAPGPYQWEPGSLALPDSVC